MIKKIKEGEYRLFETETRTRLIILDGQGQFVWSLSKKIGEVLVKSKKKYKTDKTIARGYFRVYEVLGEPGLTDSFHFEVCVGHGQWQGYLLPKGFPNNGGEGRIIPTKEVISKGTCNC
ncbi:hypothetical protein A2870_00575 [Candidatus Curtissbacteria bacterium RIFCSPHIGHO2_01_FULL_41_11]|uniref:Uncharacterized protein n=1 Tax=Candidatus Curtissbacteria bacterium RIFCSPHIGHO2_01_FULL_41_11 TaxID=1797711 RepID=A0A1F5G3B7_9BACT|nr:MAG: hypothetical protein A2870_00575 [Candidatus Curtissbacteria bacterium RIFCSPHIGHO2_01_FULL_41_11]